jgi:hypothetical protein
MSLLLGMILCYREKEGLGIAVADIESTLDVIVEQVADPLPFFARFALHILTWDQCLSVRFLKNFLNKLVADSLSYAQLPWPTNRTDNDDGSLNWSTNAAYILFFLEIDAGLTANDAANPNLYCAAFAVRYEGLPSGTVEDILTMVINAKVS